jgi:hypothetical protein
MLCPIDFSQPNAALNYYILYTTDAFIVRKLSSLVETTAETLEGYQAP